MSSEEKFKEMLEKIKREKEQKTKEEKVKESEKPAKPAEPKAAPKKTKAKCQYCGKSYSEENIEEHEESCSKNPKNMKEEEDITSRIQALEDQVSMKIKSLEEQLASQKEQMVTSENLITTIKNLFQPDETIETSKLITTITPQIETLLNEYAQKETKVISKTLSIGWDEFYTMAIEYFKNHANDKDFKDDWAKYQIGTRLTRVLNKQLYDLLPNEVKSLPNVSFLKSTADRATIDAWLRIFQLVIPSHEQTEKTELIIDYEREKFIMIARIIYQALMDSLNESLAKPGKTE